MIFKLYQTNHQLQQQINLRIAPTLPFITRLKNQIEKLQLQLSEVNQLNLQLKAKIRELEKALKSDNLSTFQQTYFYGRYHSILAQAEQAIRGSPKSKYIHLSAHSLYRRFLMNKKSILRFMTDFRVPFDNNGSERDLRMLKLQQKISGYFRTIEGVKVFCRIRGSDSNGTETNDVCLKVFNFCCLFIVKFINGNIFHVFLVKVIEPQSIQILMSAHSVSSIVS